MTTSESTDTRLSEQPDPVVEQQKAGKSWPWKAVMGWVLLAVVTVIVLVTAERNGPVGSDNTNPAGVGKPPPAEPLWPGLDILFWGQVLGAVLLAITVVASAMVWRRRPGHPTVLMLLAATTLFWWDPINNWAIGLVYNPDLWHFPRDIPWLNISPIIEPLTSVIYAPYILLPYFLAMPLLRAIQKRSGPAAFVWRHPLITIAMMTFVIGAIWDAAQEILLTRTQFLTYSHVVEFGSIDVGKNSQFPLLMASVLITMVMIPASVLLYRDDTGKTQAEKIAQRFRLHRTRPALATFGVMVLALTIAMMTFSSAFWLARTTGAASTVACPWPYPSAKTWDPKGYYESQGAQGPFTPGKASDWQIGQPDGRPTSVTVKSDRCKTGE